MTQNRPIAGDVPPDHAMTTRRLGPRLRVSAVTGSRYGDTGAWVSKG